MAITQKLASHGEEQQSEELSHECKELLSTLQKERGWRTPNLYLFQGFWCQPKEIQAIISVQRHFKAQDDDLILVTVPKSGTTWLKALAFAIVNRSRFSANHDKDHPLLHFNPHELVPFLEYKLYADRKIPDLSQFPCPRLLATHLPYGALPDSIKSSGCKMVYLCRNPFDTFVSSWHYICKIRPESLGPFSLEEGFDMFCRGVIGFGPYWDHLLGYWKESQERPLEKVLFLKYEDMKEDLRGHLVKLAEFLGCPFSLEEEKRGVIEDICRLCSFENMKNLEVNKKGKGAIANFENKDLFRKGEIGDWANHLSPWMVERLNKVIEEHFKGSGLSFKMR